MGFVQNVMKSLPSSDSLPSLQDLSSEKGRMAPLRLSFFKRRIRLKGNSKISVPLGVVLLFPLIVIILIIVLVVQHNSSPGNFMMPAGAPPAIRYTWDSGPEDINIADLFPGKSAKSTTKFS